MPLPHLPTEQVNQISRLVAQYISAQREKYKPRAVPLSVAQKGTLAEFFSPNLLASAYLLVLEGERVSNPNFYPMLRAMGFENLPDQTTMGAITFIDTVVSPEPFRDGLFFHELVHVEQYRQLGLESFSALYVRGFLSGGGYEGIPLERQAYALGARFESDRTTKFFGGGRGRKIDRGRQALNHYAQGPALDR